VAVYEGETDGQPDLAWARRGASDEPGAPGPAGDTARPAWAVHDQWPWGGPQ